MRIQRSSPSEGEDDTVDYTASDIDPGSGDESHEDLRSFNKAVESNQPQRVTVHELQDEASTNEEQSMINFHDDFATLAISAAETHSPRPSPAQSPNHRGQIGIPLTARDLYNATPQPTPKVTPTPEPRMNTPEPLLGVQNYGERGTSSNIPVEHLQDQVIPDLGRLGLEDDAFEYSVRDEPLPDEPFFNPVFQRALRSATSLAKSLSERLDHCALAHQSESDLYRLRKTAQELQRFEIPASRTIAIVGDSATGKSSLINSLLDLPNLAHNGDHGSAVTSFVTEYRYRSHFHSEPFTIEVDYSNEEEVNEQLYELLFSYRELYRPGLKEEMSESYSEYQLIEKKSEVALSTLQSIFPDNQVTTAQNLQDLAEGAFERLYKDLTLLATNLIWPEGAENGKWTSTAADVEDCNAQVALFMAQGLWPLTNIVRIYLSAQVLKTGVVFADLPGYRDINLARVVRAQQYLIRCDEVFVVANISRVLTDESVKRSLREQLGINLERSKSIAIICTHADDIDVQNAQKKYADVARLPPSKRAKQEAAVAAKKSLAEFSLADIRLKSIYTSARNADITRQLNKLYLAITGNNSINVFCVGNRDYEGKEYWTGKVRAVAINSSGIPDLRRFCHSIAARAQFRASNHFLEIELPGLVQGLELWVAASEQKVVPQISATSVSAFCNTLEEAIEVYRTALEAAFKLRIIDTSLAVEKALNEDAIGISRLWAVKHGHPMTYKAWCRNYGTHSTDRYDYECWNTDLLDKLSEAWKKQWIKLEDDFTRHSEGLQDAVKQEFLILSQQMRHFKAPETLTRSFRLIQGEITYLLNKEHSGLLRKLGIIRQNATGTHLSSYVLRIMIPTYRACSAESGKGMAKRMFEIMETRMQQKDVYRIIRSFINKHMQRSFDKTTDSLTNHFIEMCEILRRQIGTVTGAETEALKRHPEDLGKVRVIVETARSAMSKLQEDIRPTREGARRRGYIA